MGPLLLLPVSETELRGSCFGSNKGVMKAVNELFEDQNRDFDFVGLNKMEHWLGKVH
jgi:hypothetical protein